MTRYLAVVKYPVDASLKEKYVALIDGLNHIAMELVAEHDLDMRQIESVLEEAGSWAQNELDMKREREAKEK